ncbi:endo-1,4-beta-xylanase [Horticoccus sp. 23ND18S-11]|uniref:endo-1,4-beta-xylanase n=1 Tax=Horticoccus sp. 23ND18S-11 TaxID=3391832 RepID=UPI0039C8CE2D
MTSRFLRLVRAFTLGIGVAAVGLGADAARAKLREVFADDFMIGVALSTAQVDGRERRAGEIAAEQFAAVTPENDLKWQSLHPQPDRYDFKAADAYVEFARTHAMALIGHALVWHSQTPAWVFAGVGDKPATRELMLKRMRDHIHAVVGRYKGKVKGWDVVNEALSDSGDDILRDSLWRRLIGDDFIDHAFRFARDADPDAELYYNDYGLEDERKRANCVTLLRGLLARGVPVTGVGTQSHFHLDYPSLAAVDKTLAALSGLGLTVMVTELDVDVLPYRENPGIADISRRETGNQAMDPYTAGLPEAIQVKLAHRYRDLFAVYQRHRDAITRVTFWGLDDRQSWLNDFPIAGRTNHPLLFDRELKPKPAFFAVLQTGKAGGAAK